MSVTANAEDTELSDKTGANMGTVPNNAQLVAQYQRAINALETKLSRQQNAAIDTQAQIDAFRALVAQLEGKK